ncbi:alpha/beta fold hydrolase [Undibacterium sp. TJN25]|uniref:alpha/beta fold hydrolase n=1 Tax=Undibacterium sp. TJN25 TaxID=3413056 RepID=UPI003BF1C527
MYRVAGPKDAPVLVFGNALATGMALWDEQVAALRKDFRIFTFDYPSHGSPAWLGATLLKGFAGKVAGLLDALEIGDYSYCGMSMGGAIGMELAEMHAGRMQKLILSNTASEFGAADFWNRRIATAHENGMTALWESSLQRFFTAAFAEANPAVVGFSRELFMATEADGYIACCAAVRDFRFSDARLTALQLPTLVIAGSYDAATPPVQAKHLAGAIPHARYCELPVAHMGNLGASEEFTAVLGAFLREAGANA